MYADRPLVGPHGTLTIQSRVLGALILRETRSRFGRSRVGYLWALAEPLAHVLILSALFSYVRMRTPPLGDSLPVFFATGIMPYFMFIKVSNGLKKSITANAPLFYYPQVKPLDPVFARALLEGATLMVVLLILAAVFNALGANVVPDDILGVLTAFSVVFVLGLGVGTIHAAMVDIVGFWDNFSKIVQRPLYLLSGIFFVADFIPEPGRSYLLWNPIIHGLEWFRTSFYSSYDSQSLDKLYLLSWAFGSLFVGLSLERVTRKRLNRE